MKTLIHFLVVSVILIISVNVSSALNGTYTVGTGGNFPTIASAITAARNSPMTGPVIFNIKPGIYNEENVIENISGLNSVNSLTLQSESGNAADVVINGNTFVFYVRVPDIIIRNLTIGSSSTSSIQMIASIQILNNIFTNDSKLIISIGQFPPSYVIINGNTNVEGIVLNPWADYWGRFVKITNNTVTGGIGATLYDSILIENNTASVLSIFISNHIDVFKNKISGFFSISGWNSNVYNNFFYGTIPSDSSYIAISGNVIYNTFCYSSVNNVYILNNNAVFLNNLFINKSGRLAVNLPFSQPQLSDYNNFYNSGNPGLIKWHGNEFNDVSSYFNATGNDEHSNSHPVTFVSPTDLHLAGSSLGDQQLAGIPTPLVTDDIDGQPRDPYHPYKGADEYTDFPLPVELASFTSTVTGNNVNLKWTTSSEINNSGFDIEKSLLENNVSEDWVKIGSQSGNGTTNNQSSYEFIDKNLSTGKYNYRLKQIDFNGNFRYHNLAGEIVIGIPNKFSLSQNYPNPFNPKTVINYELPAAGNVSIKIFDISGKEISTLIDHSMEAGIHSAEFDGSDLSSGVYFYTLIFDGNNIDRKRMVLLK
ncbi:MAG: T9SS type A sorting domain-containing protein [Ignavibacteria bacterium]|nr:T9SS type A sorting domain-containing protein [Ignavibacteria bacterium]